MLANYLRAQQKLGNIQCGDPEQAVEILLAMIISATSLRASLGLEPNAVKTRAQRKAWVNFAVDIFLSAMQANAGR
jgi:hypothetical protein